MDNAPISVASTVPPLKELKSVDSIRLRRSYMVSAAFALFAAVLFLVAMQMPQWWMGATSGRSDTYGIGQVCSNGLCRTRHYTDANLTLCTTKGSSMESRDQATRWTLYFAIATALISCPCFVMATFQRQHYAVPALIAILLSFACAISSIAIFTATFERFIFCSTDFCTYVHSLAGSGAACYYTYGSGVVMVGCGVCFVFCGALFAIGSLVVKSSRERSLRIAVQSRNAQYEAPANFEAPQGFKFDATCGLYYSDDAQLYLDPASCHYYDPNSGLWFDTAAGSWYEIAS